MTSWILITVVAQFLNAAVALVDKYMLTSKRITRPIIYAFYVGLFSVLTLLVFFFSWIPIPFADLALPSFSNVSWPSLEIVLLALLAGTTFIGALATLFAAFARADASDVVPVTGSVSAIATLFFSFLFLEAQLTHNFFWGFTILVVGTAIVSLFRFKLSTLMFCLVSGAAFGLHYVAVKQLFNVTHFDNAYLWLNICIFIAAFGLLFVPHKKGPAHRDLRASKPRLSTYGLIVVKQVATAIAAFLILKATDMGNAALVQALGGLQFVFLLIFSITFGHKVVNYCGEHCSPWQKMQKIVSVIIITIGFIVLFI